MAGRIAWILAGGAAIVGGMLMQDRIMLGWDDEPRVERHRDAKIDPSVDVDSIVNDVIDDQTDRLTVVGEDGATIDATPELKKQMARAVAELVKAEAALAVADFRDQPRDQLRVARDRRDQAERRVDQLARLLKDREQRETVRDRKHEIRDRVRSEISDALPS